MLNIDKIRDASAEYLAEIIRICPCEEIGVECDHDSCSQCRLDWLYKEVQDD